MKIGDVVYLKSGSPELTVTDVYLENVQVMWISENDVVQRASFPKACLVVEKPIHRDGIERTEAE